jgi:uncharacterized protein YlxW (UPF0749 family)
MQNEAARRETAVAELEAKVSELSQREQTLQSRIEVLNQTNPKAAQEFITMMEQRQAVGERRSAKRDYLLFAGGVVVTIGLTLLFNALGIGT